MEFELWEIILAVVIILNVIVSIFLLRRNDLEPFQRGAQIALVWFFPFIGAVGFWLFYKNVDSIPKKRGPFDAGSQGIESSRLVDPRVILGHISTRAANH